MAIASISNSQSSLLLYTFTPCCGRFPILYFSSPSSIDYQSGSLYFFNGQCYSLTIQRVGNENALFPTLPNFGGFLHSVETPIADTVYLISNVSGCEPNNCVDNNLVVNGSFDTDLSGWEFGSPPKWTWDAGVARYDGADEGGTISQNVFTVGQTYDVTFTLCITYDVGATYPVEVNIGGNLFYYDSVGCQTITETIVASAEVFSVSGFADGGEAHAYTLDDVCVIEIANEICPSCNEEPCCITVCMSIESERLDLITECIELNAPTGFFQGKPYWQFSLFNENFELIFIQSWRIYNIAVIGQPPNNGALYFVSKNQTDCPTNTIFDSENEFIPFAEITECLAPIECLCFLLIDCSTGEELIYSGNVLNEYIDRVIQVNIDGVIKCFSVQETPCSEESLELVFDYIILDCFDINECLLCLPKPEPIKKPKLRYVQPGYTTALCDPDKVEKIKCTFADLMYQQAMSRRFNIKFCCPKDLGLWQLRNEKIMLELTKFNNPTPDPCNPICKTYAYEFEANRTGNIVYTDCDNTAIVIEVTESNEPQRFDFCALDYPGVNISITNSLGVLVDTFTIQPIEVICSF